MKTWKITIEATNYDTETRVEAITITEAIAKAIREHLRYPSDLGKIYAIDIIDSNAE